MRQFFVLFYILLLFSACDDSFPDIEDCPIQSDWKIVDQEEAFLTCIHYEVYEFNDELYWLCSNCELDKIAFPIDCDGVLFCPFDPDDFDIDAVSQCIDEFYEEAEFQFYMIEG